MGICGVAGQHLGRVNLNGQNWLTAGFEHRSAMARHGWISRCIVFICYKPKDWMVCKFKQQGYALTVPAKTGVVTGVEPTGLNRKPTNTLGFIERNKIWNVYSVLAACDHKYPLIIA